MNEPPLPGAGDVELELGGETVVLKCSPEVALTLARERGSIYGHEQAEGVVQRLLACDIDTMCLIIRLGCGQGRNAVPNLPKMVYEAGIVRVRDALSRYIGSLANGGKPFVVGGATEDANPRLNG